MRVVLEWLAEQEGHVVIRMRDGAVREGWIVEVKPTHIVFEQAPSPFHAQATGTDEMAPPPERIGIEAIAAWLDDDRNWHMMP